MLNKHYLLIRKMLLKPKRKLNSVVRDICQAKQPFVNGSSNFVEVMWAPKWYTCGHPKTSNTKWWLGTKTQKIREIILNDPKIKFIEPADILYDIKRKLTNQKSTQTIVTLLRIASYSADITLYNCFLFSHFKRTLVEKKFLGVQPDKGIFRSKNQSFTKMVSKSRNLL